MTKEAPATGGEPKKEGSVAPDLDGPSDCTESLFEWIKVPAARACGVEEYNRVVGEFRQTGQYAKKTWQDFSHLASVVDEGAAQVAAWDGHVAAHRAICRWQDSHPSRAADIRRPDAHAAGDPGRVEEREDKSPSIADALPELGARIERHKARLEGRAPDPAKLVAPKTRRGTEAVLVRGVEFDPRQQSLLGSCGPFAPQLEIAPPPERLPEDGTEQLLNDLIGECHFLMREVAFRSMCQTTALEDRMRWVDRAMDLAKTGARVAKAVAQLRHGAVVKETRHTLNVANNVGAVAGGI